MYRRECKARGGDALKVFNKMIKSGEPAGFAAACALQQAPMSKKAGINTHGKFFNGIGRYSDPASWSSNQQDVIDAAKRKNLKLEGPVNCNYMREDLPPPKKKPLAEDIVKNEALKLMTADPALAAKVRKSPKAKEDLRRQIQATHSRG